MNVAIKKAIGNLPFIRHIFGIYADVKILRRDLADFRRFIIGSFPIPVEDYKMFLDINDNLDLFKRVYEEGMIERRFIKREVKEGDVVIDVGAHIGYFTLLFADLVGKRGKVFAFEPHPENFKLLERNIKLNGFQNVILEQKAVSDKNGEDNLYISKDDSGDHRLYPSDERTSIKVKTVRLDDYIKNFKTKVDFVKIDTEGKEPFIIQGMREILAVNSQMKMIVEYLPAGLERCGVNKLDYLTLLKKAGFDIFYVDYQKNIMLPIESNFTDRITQEDYANLICVK